MIKVRDYPSDVTMRKQFSQIEQRTENKYAVRTQTIATDPIEQLRGALNRNRNKRQFPRVHTRACLSSASKGYARSERHQQSLVAMKITDQMIEAAAKAIREQVAARSTHRYAMPRPWNALPDTLKDAYRAEALCALDAALALPS